jgi:tetratricopeptide (TPR) repeat protein
LPDINLKIIGLSLVGLLAVVGGAAAWFWYSDRPDKIYESARAYFEQGEKLRGAKSSQTKPSEDDLSKAKKAYESSQTQVERFVAKAPQDSRVPEAYMLRYKSLWAQAGIVGQKEEADKTPLADSKANGLREEAFRSADRALALSEEKNVEALAAVFAKHFGNNDFRSAQPLARALIENLPPDPLKVEMEDFPVDVIAAYYVVAAKEIENGKPDQALKYLDDSLALERALKPGAKPRWRAAALEIVALHKKVEQTKNPKEVRAAEEKLQAQLTQYLERARAELKETVPTPDGKGTMPLLATLSLTNGNGLIDILVMGVLKSDSHAMTVDRADLLLQVCEKLADTADARSTIYQDAVRGSSRLAAINGPLAPNIRLTAEEMAKAQERTIAINDRILEKGGPIDPTAYLEMSRTAQHQNNRARALEMAKRGLKLAADQHIGPGDGRVQSLQAQAAWMLLLDQRPREAEEYLSALGKQKQLKDDVAHMRGLGAVLDGRLDEGVQQLNIARKNPRYKDNLSLLLALSFAYVAQGQLEEALPVLEQLYKIRRTLEIQNREDQIWVAKWQPTLTHASLSLFKCKLAMALKLAAKPKDVKEADELEKQAVKEHFAELSKTFVAEEALAAFVNYKLARLRLVEAKAPGSLQADLMRKEVERIMKETPSATRNDPRMLWTEINVILSQPETNGVEVVGAVAAAIGAPTDMAVRLGELGRLQSGFAWQWLKAEQRIMQAVAEQKGEKTIQLAWVRWLLLNGRTDDAVAKLTELEDKAKDEKERRQLQMARARLLVTTGQRQKADELIQEMRQGGQDLDVALIYADTLLLTGNEAEAQRVVTEALNKPDAKQDETGMYYFWQGQIHQRKGDYSEAIPSYERALQYTQFKTRSQSAILACVLGIAGGPPGKPDKANPEGALKEARRLRAAHPHDPVILLTYAIAARQMDDIYDDAGMEGALADMIKALAEDKANAANGPYVAAQQWVAAGRPDRARQELKSNKNHLPSVVLAMELASADESWAEMTADLQAAEKLMPEALDLPLWRALLHQSKGELKEAREIYVKFIEAHPKLNTGYLGLARMHERAKEYKEALDWVKKWREKMPEELNGQQALVRVLARDGQVAEAAKQADAFIRDAVEKVRHARDEWEAKNPITETDKDKAKALAEQRARDRAETIEVMELTLTLQFIGELQRGGAFAEAEKWLNARALPLVEKLPEELRKRNRLALKLVRASLYLEQGRQLKEKSPERAKYMDLAIQEYDDVYKEEPGNLVAGNNLAWLLVKEKNEPARALGLVEEVRKGKFSRQPISPERLMVDFLDTLGVVYRANGMNQESLNLFKEATQKHYNDDPRVIMHLGLAQAALGFKSDAAATFRRVVNLSEEHAKATTDPERKEVFAKLVTEAKDEQKKIGLLAPPK